LIKTDAIVDDPMIKIRVLKAKKKLPHFVQENEMVAVLDNHSDFTPTNAGLRGPL